HGHVAKAHLGCRINRRRGGRKVSNGSLLRVVGALGLRANLYAGSAQRTTLRGRFGFLARYRRVRGTNLNHGLLRLFKERGSVWVEFQRQLYAVGAGVTL